MQRMQTPRKSSRLIAVLAALSFATALVAGCSSASKKNSSPLPDAGTLVKQSSQTTKNVRSVHVVLSTTGKVKGLPIKTLTGDLTTAPSTAAKGNAKVVVGGSDIDADFVVYDSNLYATLTPNVWTDLGPAADIYDVSTILNPDNGLGNVLANFTDAKAEGRETVAGQNTVRISGKVAPDALNRLAPSVNATQPLPATVWIQENGDHQLVQAKMEPSSGNTIQMTLSNWGEQVQVTKPQVS